METKAVYKYAKISAQKARLVADLVRNQSVERAQDILKFSLKRGATMVKKALDSAIANAEHNEGADIDELNISAIYVDEAPTLRRWRARAKGRGATILKRSCHITVEVSDMLEEREN